MEERSALNTTQLPGEPFFWEAGPVGVLLSHGFTATPFEVRGLACFLHERGYTVLAPLLPGHGTTPEEMNRCRWQDWTAAVEAAYRTLAARSERVFVGGESLGGLLALYLATEHPEVAGILAFAPALKIRSRLDRWRGIAIGCGMCPHVSDDDPYMMALRAVDEALRNVICVGADPGRVAILDNFCWGGCATPEALGTLVRACKGAYDAAVAYGLPFISGKDSLNNQFAQDSEQAKRLGLPERITIPGTLLISAVGMVEDVRGCVSMDLKRAGNALVLVAQPVDRAGLTGAYEVHRAVAAGIRGGAVRSAHDISDGGLAVALAEMCLAGGLGARVEVNASYGADLPSKLFEEYATGYVLECESSEALNAVGGVRLGEVTEASRLVVKGGGTTLVDLDVNRLVDAWRAPLSRRMGGEVGA